MKVGDLVRLRHQHNLGLVAKVRSYETRESVCFVQWTKSYDGDYLNRWYDMSDLKLIEGSSPTVYSADPI
jgi:hypothetical protein